MPEAKSDDRPQVQILVTLHGGTIDGVAVVGDEVHVTDVVFLESYEYLQEDLEGDCFRVKGVNGTLGDEAIYAHWVDIDSMPKWAFDLVQEASAARCDDAVSAEDWESMT